MTGQAQEKLKGAHEHIAQADKTVAVRRRWVRSTRGQAITLLKGRDVAAMFDEQVQPLLGDADRAPVAVTNNQGGTNS